MTAAPLVNTEASLMLQPTPNDGGTQGSELQVGDLAEHGLGHEPGAAQRDAGEEAEHEQRHRAGCARRAWTGTAGVLSPLDEAEQRPRRARAGRPG